MWKGRKSAFAAVGRISPSYFVQDGVIPRTRLPEVLDRDRARWPTRSGCASPTSSTPATATCTRSCCSTTRSRARPHDAEELAGAILDLCIAAGGSITGEHGVGHEKRHEDGQAVHAGGPRHHAAACAAPSTPTASPTPARSSRHRGCAASGPASGPGEHPVQAAGAGRGVLMTDRDRRAPSRNAAATPSPGRPARGRAPGLASTRSPRSCGPSAADGRTVVPVGGGTKTSWAAPPTSCDLLLRHHRPGPGRRARRRRSRRRRRGRRAAGRPAGTRSAGRPAARPRPARRSGATLGGVVSANASGPAPAARTARRATCSSA